MLPESSILAPKSTRSGRYATVQAPEPLPEDDCISEIPSTPLPRHQERPLGRQAMTLLTIVLSICVVILSIHVHNQQSTIQALTRSHDSSRSKPLKWLPLPSNETIITRLAFGSCARQDMPQPYWDTMSTTFQPQLVLLMGDNIYGDCDDDACTKLFKAYDDLAAHPSVQGAARKFPVFATLDDHDYGQGDCHADNPYKELARRNPFQATNDSTAPYTPITDPDMPQQMLSERQWTWLAEELEKPADLRVIVSSIQVMNDVCVFESWRMLPKERQRLYDLIQHKVNVLLVSGDRHVGAFLESEDGGTPEVTASSFTHSIPLGAYGSNCSTPEECDEPDPRRMGPLVRENHFGSLEIDWNTREYVVALRRAETTYGTMYHHKWDSDAGQVIMSRNYTISEFPL